MNLQEAALKYRASGLNILPASKETKRPRFSKWRGFCSEKCTTPITDAVSAIAVVCGEVSGRLEIIDFDFQAEDFDAWKKELESIDAGYLAFLDALLIERTQNGGLHVAYRVEGDVPLKTQKLTNKELFPEEKDVFTKQSGKKEVKQTKYKGKEITQSSDGHFYYGTIETRAEGSIAIIAPTNGYEVIQGSWELIPVIPFEFREAMFKAAFNLSCLTIKPVLKTAPSEWYDQAKIQGDEIDVAQYLRESDAAKKLLLQNGWTLASENYDGDSSLWRRPGKTRGVSATLNEKTGKFWSFTSNAAISPLTSNRAYTPLQLYAAFNCGGDERAASIEVLQTLEQNAPFQYEDLSFLFGTTKGVINEDIKILNEEPPKKESVKYQSIYDITLPDCCLNPGGILEAMMDYTDSISLRLQRRLSFAASATTFGHITARRVCVGNKASMLSPALFTIVISPPSSGKGAGLFAADKFARLISTPAQISNGFESVQKFYDILEAAPNQFLIADEFGNFLSSINAEKTNSVRQRLLDAWVQVYTSYNRTSFQAPSSIRKGDSPIIYRPALSIYGVTNFAEFQTALRGNLLKNGFSARFLYLIGDKEAKAVYQYDDEDDDETKAEIPESLKESIFAWHKVNEPVENAACQSDPFRVRIERRADEFLCEYSNEQNIRFSALNDSEEDVAEKSIVGRSLEKTKKYALLFACSKFGANINNLKIDLECARKAVELNRYELDVFNYLKETELADSIEEKNVLMIKRWLRNINEDAFSLSAFTNKFRKIGKKDRETALSSLCDENVLEACWEDAQIGSDGKPKMRKRFYRILKK